ncbi:hypothetical protein D3C72_2137360 [compost metagenome]
MPLPRALFCEWMSMVWMSLEPAHLNGFADAVGNTTVARTRVVAASKESLNCMKWSFVNEEWRTGNMQQDAGQPKPRHVVCGAGDSSAARAIAQSLRLR